MYKKKSLLQHLTIQSLAIFSDSILWIFSIIIVNWIGKCVTNRKCLKETVDFNKEPGKIGQKSYKFYPILYSMRKPPFS